MGFSNSILSIEAFRLSLPYRHTSDNLRDSVTAELVPTYLFVRLHQGLVQLGDIFPRYGCEAHPQTGSLRDLSYIFRVRSLTSTLEYLCSSKHSIKSNLG